jgi:bacteriorhodopsin
MAFLAYNERMKFRATWLNTVSAGMLVVGFITPIASAMKPVMVDGVDQILLQVPSEISLVIGLAWLGVALTLHWMAVQIAGKVLEP